MSIPNKLQIHDDLGPLLVFFKDNIWRYVGELPEVLCQVVIIGIAELNRYSQPVNIRMFFFIIERLVKPTNAAVELGSNTDPFIELSLKLPGT